MSQFFESETKNNIQNEKTSIQKYPKIFKSHKLQEKCDLQVTIEARIVITILAISFIAIPITVGIFHVGASIALIIVFMIPFVVAVIPQKIKKTMIGLYAIILLFGISIFSVVVDSPILIALGVFVTIIFGLVCKNILNRVEKKSENRVRTDYGFRNYFSYFNNEKTITITPELMKITKTQYDILKQKNTGEMSQNWRNLRVGTLTNLVLSDIKDDIDWIYEKSKLEKPIILIADNYLEQRLMANQILFGLRIQNRISGILLQPSKYPISRFIQKKIREQSIQQTGTHQNIPSSTLLKIQNDSRTDGFSSLNQIMLQRKDPLAYTNHASDKSIQMIPIRGNDTESYLRDAIENQTKIKIEKMDEEFVDQKFSVFYHSGLLDLCDVLEENNIIKNEISKRYLNIIRKGVYEILFFEKYVILSRLPTKISMDDDDRLHSLAKPAIEWRGLKDEFYYIHGVQFEKKLWLKITKRTMSVLDVLKIRNIEQRYIALQIYGIEKVLSELDSELIDKSARGNELYKLEGLAAGKTFRLLRYSCPSTSRRYISFVPDYINTADSGMAWKFQITEDEYAQLRIEA